MFVFFIFVYFYVLFLGFCCGQGLEVDQITGWKKKRTLQTHVIVMAQDVCNFLIFIFKKKKTFLSKLPFSLAVLFLVLISVLFYVLCSGELWWSGGAVTLRGGERGRYCNVLRSKTDFDFVWLGLFLHFWNTFYSSPGSLWSEGGKQMNVLINLFPLHAFFFFTILSTLKKICCWIYMI